MNPSVVPSRATPQTLATAGFPAKQFAASVALALLLPFSASAEWSLHEVLNKEMPGKSMEVRQNGDLVARFIYGEGQLKQYLHVYGDDADLLTEWSPQQRYPHHRGIFVGWKITCDLGTFDLWHHPMMEVVSFDTLKTSNDSATIAATITWHASEKDASGSNLLLTEKRTMTISRPAGRGSTQIDTGFHLQAARPLKLTGDLQHAGVHFRAAADVVNRERETSYLHEPDGAVRGDNLKWVRFLFPIKDRWYSALQINAPSNPVEELSMRTYGRFGYFFHKDLTANQSVDLSYRFITSRVEPPAIPPRLSPEQAAKARAEAEAQYQAFAGSRGR